MPPVGAKRKDAPAGGADAPDPKRLCARFDPEVWLPLVRAGMRHHRAAQKQVEGGRGLLSTLRRPQPDFARLHREGVELFVDDVQSVRGPVFGARFQPAHVAERGTTYHRWVDGCRVECDASDEGARENTQVPWADFLRLFARDATGATYAVEVHRFCAYLVVDLPVPARAQAVRAGLESHLLQCAISRARRFGNDTSTVSAPEGGYVVGWEPEPHPRTPAYGYAHACTTMVRVYLESERNLRAAGAYLRHVHHLATYESGVRLAKRFITDTGISGGAWVRVPAGRFALVTGPKVSKFRDGRLTRCGAELRVLHTDLEVLADRADLPPQRVLSLDIECLSRSRRFPQPANNRVITVAFTTVVRGGTGGGRAAGEDAGELVGPGGHVRNIVSRDVFQLGDTAPWGADVRLRCYDAGCRDTELQLDKYADFLECNPRAHLKHPEAHSVWQAARDKSSLFAGEREMFEDMAAAVETLDPDVITGYNVKNFDMMYLMDRAAALGRDTQRRFNAVFTRMLQQDMTRREVTRCSKATGTRTSQEYATPGRAIIDMLDAARKTVQLGSYSLNSVARAKLGDSKQDMPYDEIPAAQDGTRETRRRLAEYCEYDAVLPVRLYDYFLVLARNVEMARVCKITLAEDYSRGMQHKVDSLKLNFSHRRPERFVWPDVFPMNFAPGAPPFMPPTDARYRDAVFEHDADPEDLVYPNAEAAAAAAAITNPHERDRRRRAANAEYDVADWDESGHVGEGPDDDDDGGVLGGQDDDDDGGDGPNAAKRARIDAFFKTEAAPDGVDMASRERARAKALAAAANEGVVGGGNKSVSETLTAAVAYEGARVLPPKVGFYKGKVVILDFASLYPSIMRGWNLCYTSLVVPGTTPPLPEGTPTFTTPRGFTFVKHSVRQGVLPEMLKEILGGRKRAKNDLKAAKAAGNAALVAVMDARQLSLKIAANSVYGYTGAPPETGICPCQPIAASVTAYGREMLDRTKEHVEAKYTQGTGWSFDTDVVYGDSVTGDTALVLRNDETGAVCVKRIDEVAVDEARWARWHTTKEACDTPGWSVWSDAGFTPLQRVIRHRRGAKALVRVVTTGGTVDCTEDHSLVRSNGTEVRPRDVGVGDALLHHRVDVAADEYRRSDSWARGARNIAEGREIVLGRGWSKVEVTRMCIEAGFQGKEAQFAVDRYTGNVRVRFFTRSRATAGASHPVTSVRMLHTESRHDYVYDLQTGSHHFHVGPGALVVHNTDSVMVYVGDAPPEEVFKFGKVAGRVCSEFLCEHFGVEGLVLEFEKVCWPYLLLRKKRYAGIEYETLDEMLEGRGKLYMKGIETQRRDACGLVRRVLEQILHCMLRDVNMEAALGVVQRAVRDLQMGRVDLSELMVTRALTRPMHEYKGRQGIVELARKMAARDPALAPGVGMRIPYVLVAGTPKTKMYELYEDPLYVLQHAVPLHVPKYLEKLQKSTQRILGVVRPVQVAAIFKRAAVATHSVKGSVAHGDNALTRAFTNGAWTATQRCAVCRNALPPGVHTTACDACHATRPAEAVARHLEIVAEYNHAEREASACRTQCLRCTRATPAEVDIENAHAPVSCSDVTCPIFFRRTTSARRAAELRPRALVYE